MTQLEIQLPSEDATTELARLVAPLLNGGDLLVLTGDLGAGKTYFAGALCRALGLDQDEPVTSPTFALVSEYQTSLLVLHADLYRLRDPSDVFELGLWDRRAEGALLVVEWGLPFASDLGGDPIEIAFGIEPRRARFPAHGSRSLGFFRDLSDAASAHGGSLLCAIS
jgi:tRNA threonylcarbamoyladenosine biosynthesis protein TsaE